MNNTGYDGGALALYEGSEIVIGRHAHVKFIGNHAKHFGGAIYVDNYVFTDNRDEPYDQQIISCFYKFVAPFTTSMSPHVFENNTADYAGSALYGGYIDLCEIDLWRPFKPDFNSMFQFNGGESDYSVISSDPLRVCLCIDSRPKCSIIHYNVSAYPGTTIQLPAVAVGQRFGTVPSTVRSDFVYELMNGIHPKSKPGNILRKLKKIAQI